MFLAAMLAYVTSVRLGLPQSYWAVVTCVVVMNPTTGAVRSKAVYRFTAPLFAGLASLLLASSFARTPLLLFAGVGLAATPPFGPPLFVRPPRPYGAQLLGIPILLI